MLNTPPALHDRASPPAEAGPDPAIVRAEQRLAMLRELAEIGMRLARAAVRAAALADDFFDERRANLRHLVREAAEFEIKDAEALRDIRHALEEHLQCDYAYQDIAERPLRESVERLCRDLKLNPDWRRWDGDRWLDADPIAKPPNKPPGRTLE
jgi:hypothetical protein